MTTLHVDVVRLILAFLDPPRAAKLRRVCKLWYYAGRSLTFPLAAYPFLSTIQEIYAPQIERTVRKDGANMLDSLHFYDPVSNRWVIASSLTRQTARLDILSAVDGSIIKAWKEIPFFLCFQRWLPRLDGDVLTSANDAHLPIIALTNIRGPSPQLHQLTELSLVPLLLAQTGNRCLPSTFSLPPLPSSVSLVHVHEDMVVFTFELACVFLFRYNNTTGELEQVYLPDNLRVPDAYNRLYTVANQAWMRLYVADEEKEEGEKNLSEKLVRIVYLNLDTLKITEGPRKRWLSRSLVTSDGWHITDDEVYDMHSGKKIRTWQSMSYPRRYSCVYNAYGNALFVYNELTQKWYVLRGVSYTDNTSSENVFYAEK